MRKKYIWLAVEADEYELPIAVADTAKELGEMLGTTKGNVETNAKTKCSGTISGRKFVKIEI